MEGHKYVKNLIIRTSRCEDILGMPWNSGVSVKRFRKSVKKNRNRVNILNIRIKEAVKKESTKKTIISQDTANFKRI